MDSMQQKQFMWQSTEGVHRYRVIFEYHMRKQAKRLGFESVPLSSLGKCLDTNPPDILGKSILVQDNQNVKFCRQTHCDISIGSGNSGFLSSSGVWNSVAYSAE